jgi:hypothetical protein
MESLVRKNGGFFIDANSNERLHYPDSRTSPKIQQALHGSVGLERFKTKHC